MVDNQRIFSTKMADKHGNGLRNGQEVVQQESQSRISSKFLNKLFQFRGKKLRFLGDFIDPELAAGLGADAIIGPISPFLHLPPSLDVNLRSTSSGGDEADVGGDEPPLLAVVPETEPPGKLVRWFWRYFEFYFESFFRYRVQPCQVRQCG